MRILNKWSPDKGNRTRATNPTLRCEVLQAPDDTERRKDVSKAESSGGHQDKQASLETVSVKSTTAMSYSPVGDHCSERTKKEIK